MSRVKWDEQNLHENDESRCSTMVIDEPPTPFNFEYCEDEEDEDEEEQEPGSTEKDKIKSSAVVSKSDGGEKGLSFAEQWENSGVEEALSDPNSLRPSCVELTDEERKAAKIEFEKNRKRHYEMKAVLSKPIDEDDDDEESEGSDGSAPNGKRPAAAAGGDA